MLCDWLSLYNNTTDSIVILIVSQILSFQVQSYSAVLLPRL